MNPIGPGVNKNKGWDDWVVNSLQGGPADRKLKIKLALLSNATLPPTNRRSPPHQLTDPPTVPPTDTAVADTGASGFYLTPNAPCSNVNPNALKIVVGTTSGSPHRSSAACDILLSNLPTTTGHIMPNFQHNLIGVSPLFNHNCWILFEKTAVTFFSDDGTVLLRGHRETSGAKLWQFSLHPQSSNSVLPEW